MSALIGKAGEALVAAELLRRQVNVAYPAYDGGIDLLAYHEPDFNRVVPIQIKAASSIAFNFERVWFRIERIVLVKVWSTATKPEFYIFASIQHVEEALGSTYSASPSWVRDGRYANTRPTPDVIERMQPHRDRWERILEQL